MDVYSAPAQTLRWHGFVQGLERGAKLPFPRGTMLVSSSAAHRAAPSRHAEVPDMSGSYDRYIASGLYDRRYPRPNRRTLRRLLGRLPAGGRFLDFGAGTGRYTLPLLQRPDTHGIACDICPTARAALSERLRTFVDDGRLAVRDADMATFATAHAGAFDLVLMAFGVLGHVAGEAARRELLRFVHTVLKPGGSLILSLPNAGRRFRAEQRASAGRERGSDLEAGDVLYTRGGGTIRMFYHLYTRSALRETLEAATFRVESVEAESLLAEETVVASPVLGRLDDLACHILPAAWGYGFLVVARPLARSGA